MVPDSQFSNIEWLFKFKYLQVFSVVFDDITQDSGDFYFSLCDEAQK